MIGQFPLQTRFLVVVEGIHLGYEVIVVVERVLFGRVCICISPKKEFFPIKGDLRRSAKSI